MNKKQIKSEILHWTKLAERDDEKKLEREGKSRDVQMYNQGYNWGYVQALEEASK